MLPASGLNDFHMRISVITVSFNALPDLQRTLESVTHQAFDDFEYIVVDGASSDGTIDYLRENRDRIHRCLSEPDNGIYEAMNKGVRLAMGEYCLFLNAGDCLIHDRVLSRVASYLDGTDIVLGNEILVNEHDKMCGFTPAKGSFTLQHLLTGSVCHQATFIRRALLLEHPYDESLRLVSDWKFILERFLDPNCTFKTIDEDVCFFRAGGKTDRERVLGRAERTTTIHSILGRDEETVSFTRGTLRTRIKNHLTLLLKRIQYKVR